MDINKITLQYLINPNIYKKYIDKDKSEEDTDKIFYKERIIDLTEKLFESQSNNIGLNEAFNNYIKECMTHLYCYDKTSNFQECYEDLSLNTKIIECSNNEIDLSGNDILIMKKKEVNKMDNYVKKIKKTTITKSNYPKQKEFNYLDSKYKGKKEKNLHK
tara:strand:+ start:37 stop:516 length:480 start_codon:yes stop_codon:yes gene_type:complete